MSAPLARMLAVTAIAAGGTVFAAGPASADIVTPPGACVGAGQWQTVLLADGNTGIGGAPARLLRRVRELLAPGGSVLCELQPWASPAGPVRLDGLGSTSAWFPWSVLDAPSLRAAAGAADLTPADAWECDGRSFLELVRA